MSTTTKKFKDYYADEEFKEKHLKYLKEKVECECGRIVSRVSMYRHKVSPMHAKRMESLPQPTHADIETLKREVKQLRSLIETKKKEK